MASLNNLDKELGRRVLGEPLTRKAEELLRLLCSDGYALLKQQPRQVQNQITTPNLGWSKVRTIPSPQGLAVLIVKGKVTFFDPSVEVRFGRTATSKRAWLN